MTLQPLSVVVLDDPSLAEAIRRELGARLDREAQVESLASVDLMAQSALRHDVVIYPPRLMGEFIARGWIDPLPPAARDDEDLDMADVFTAIRQQEIRWGNQVYAVPFGSPVPVLIVREDLLEQLDLEIPTTWQAYAACVEAIQASGLLMQEGTTLKSATLEPTADESLPALLFARAASYVKHTDNLSLSLDLASGKSLLATNGFVRAAEQMQAMIETMPATHRGLSPGEVAGAVLRGDSVMGIGWIDATTGGSQSNLPLKFAPLPGSAEIYDVANDRWEPLEGAAHRIPLISAAGMVGSVSSLS
ncbi:MAG: extracellular solute-binding protein, partial [Pirellulaceae bacterium]